MDIIRSKLPGTGDGGAFCALQNVSAIPPASVTNKRIRLLFLGKSMPDVTTASIRRFLEFHVYTLERLSRMVPKMHAPQFVQPEFLQTGFL